MLKWLGNQLKTVDEPFSISRTEGSTIITGETMFKRNGKIVDAIIAVNANSSTIAAGGSIFAGTLNTQKLLPVTGARLIGYFGNRPLVCTINRSGGIVIRNTSTVEMTLTGNVYVAGTYMIN